MQWFAKDLVPDRRALGAAFTMAFAVAACAQSAPGTFARMGSLAQAREFQSAVLLADGRVLIAGGELLTGPSYASAELYDPHIGAFAATGSMTATRTNQAAVLLPDGDVLVVGGMDDADHALASAELYGPRSGTFRATGSMNVPRRFPTATLLPDGEVLVAGGQDTGDLASSAELYDPTSGTFRLTGPMTTYRRYAIATLLPGVRSSSPEGRTTAASPWIGRAVRSHVGSLRHNRFHDRGSGRSHGDAPP